jgi:multiple sugar transport system substrate-binding protein
MKMWQTKVGLTFILLLSLVLAACGGDAGTSADGKTTVTYMTWESTTTNAAIDAAMKKFSDANITVTREPSPSGDFDQKISSMIQAQKLPDFFWCGNDQEQNWGTQGVLFDWASYIDKKDDGFDKNNFAPEALKNWYSADGTQLYGLPTLMNTYGYFYNEDLLKAAGVALPKNGWTYDDLFAAAKALTKKDGDKVTQYGALGGPYSDPFMMGHYAASAGGANFTDRVVGPTKVTADPKLAEGLEKFVSAIKDGNFTPPNYTIGDSNAAFLAGKIPLLWGGQWNAASFITSNPTFKIGFAPMPIVNKPVQLYDAVGICSPSTLKNPDAVWKVMTYLNTQAWKDILPGSPVAPAAYLPASSTYYAALKSKDMTSTADAVDYMLKTPTKGAVRFMASWSSKANDVITANWNDMLSGKKPIHPTLEDMVNQINDIIKQGS